jgi:penicillin amidase
MTIRRLGLRLGAAVILVALLAALAVWWRLWSALPAIDGRVAVDGLGAPVEIVRDTDGVPHIRAASEADAFFAQGYAHAQDRLWQMEFQRRIARGRLSAILGRPALEADRLLRTLGLARSAESAAAALRPEVRTRVLAYVAGVNAFVASHRGRRLPAEFAIFGIEPEPFRIADVIAWTKAMAFALDGNWRDELLRPQLVARVGAERAAQLMPAYTADGPIIVPDFTIGGPPPDGGTAASRIDPRHTVHLASLARVAADVSRLTGLGLPGRGSNNWVVAGSRTATGRPLLASDPHLAVQIPSVWYLAHLTAPGFDAIGASLPGVPGIVIGHNGRVAWGMTNLMADVQDLYVERVRGWSEVEQDGVWAPLRVVHETIEVRGERDVALPVRITRHGPIVSDVVSAPAALALRWTALDAEDHTLEGFLAMARARSADELRRALSRIHIAMQNVVFADADGNIGYQAAGSAPVRAGWDGTLPVEGWTGTNEWQGYVPLDRLPHALNPPGGILATANNKAAPDGYPYLLSTNWEPPYRAARILSRLDASPQLTLDDMAGLQADQHSVQALTLRPFLLRARPASSRGRAALEALTSWDGDVSASSAGAAIFEAWSAAIPVAVFGDELGPALLEAYLQDGRHAALALDALAAAGDPDAWCDDVGTPEHERCETTLGLALESALESMSRLQGGDEIGAWRWGRANVVRLGHAPLEAAPVLGRLLGHQLEAGGDRYTVNPTMRIRSRTLVSSYRQIVDLADPDRSRFVLTAGQSGHAISRHYSDLLDSWRRAAYVPMRFSRQAADAAARGRLTLVPAR